MYNHNHALSLFYAQLPTSVLTKKQTIFKVVIIPNS